MRVLWKNQAINTGQALQKQVSESPITLKCEGILTSTTVKFEKKSQKMKAILGETYYDFFVRCLIV